MPEPIQIDEHGNILIKINWKRTLKVFTILLAAWGAYYLPIEGLTEASRICMMIFIGAAGLWAVGFLVSLAGLLLFCIGLYLSIPVIIAAHMVAYRKIFPGMLPSSGSGV